MFAPHQAKAAAELLRVVKPGGRIGRFFSLVTAFVPAPAGLA
jgi:hypothetical protein